MIIATLMKKLIEAGNVTKEVRIEFTGDDQTPQEVAAMDERIDEDGNEYVCLVVRNT